MKVIFMGTPQIAVKPLQTLIDAGVDIPLVISQPDKPRGRGNQVMPPPVKELAERYSIKVYQPERLRGNKEAKTLIASLTPDFFAVVAYGRILPREILDIPRIAPINLHFSLLPKYRGAAPVNWALLNGESESGVVTMKMDEGMDTGDILLRKSTPISNKNAVTLAEELSNTGSELLLETLKLYQTIIPQKQVEALATIAPMLKKEIGHIDWKMDGKYIERMMRALVPWPTAYSFLKGKLLKFYSAALDNVENSAGTIYSVGKDYISVGTGTVGLTVTEIQMEGKRRMTVKEFLSGYKVNVGDTFE
jgi:methionyl-tRNA formyltransferase